MVITEATSFPHPGLAYPPQTRQQIDNMQRNIPRWYTITSPTHFRETVFDHEEDMIAQLQSIQRHFPALAREVDFSKVAQYVYTHDLTEAGPGDFMRNGSDTYENQRQKHRVLEEKYFESVLKPMLPSFAHQLHAEYEDPKSEIKEVLFAHALDKAHSSTIALKHFYNPRRFNTGARIEQRQTFDKTIKAMLEPTMQLRRLLASQEAVQELDVLIRIMLHRFSNAGYEDLVQEASLLQGQVA